MPRPEFGRFSVGGSTSQEVCAMATTTETPETVDRDLLLRIYETVARIRAFDDKAQALIGGAQAFFVHYPVRGHEIISAAVGAALDPDDYMTATYRGTGD